MSKKSKEKKEESRNRKKFKMLAGAGNYPFDSFATHAATGFCTSNVAIF
jgi:hypothetical protein